MALFLFRSSAIPSAELGPARGPFPTTLLTPRAPTPAAPRPVMVQMEGVALERDEFAEAAAAAPAPDAAAVPAGTGGFFERLARTPAGRFVLGLLVDTVGLGLVQVGGPAGAAIAGRIRSAAAQRIAQAAAAPPEQLAPPQSKPAEPSRAGDYAPREAEIGYNPRDLVITHELGAETARGTVQTIRGPREFTFEVPFPEAGFGG